jgi:hypothetical protein
MSRHVIPCAFWLATAVCGALLLVLGVRAADPADPKLTTTLQGFSIGFVSYQQDFGQQDFGLSEVGLVHFAIDQPFNRRYLGTLKLQTEEWTLFNAINITVPRDDFYVGTGVGPAGKFTMQGGLVPFEGGALISSTELRFHPVGRRAVSASTLALRAFDDATDPPAFGSIWCGTFQSLRDPGFRGRATLRMDQPDEPSLSFQGGLVMAAGMGEQQVMLAFDHFGTIHATDRRFVMIGQGGGGRLTAEGFIASSPERGTFADVRYKVFLKDGNIDYGAYSFTLTSFND